MSDLLWIDASATGGRPWEHYPYSAEAAAGIVAHGLQFGHAVVIVRVLDTLRIRWI